jgi:hypothetical protein
MDDAQIQEILSRLQALELVAQGDGAAVPSFYTINNEGDVELVESEIINELVSEEGDLIVGGEGKKAKTLHAGKKGQVLAVGEGGVLEWVEPGGGGGGLEGASGVAALEGFTNDPEFPEFDEGFAAVNFEVIGFEPKRFFCQAFRPNGSEEAGETGQAFIPEINPKTKVVNVSSRWKTLTPASVEFWWLALK